MVSAPAEIIARLRAAGCVYAEEEATLLAEAAGSPAELTELTDRRVAGLPLERVLGWAEFCGLRIQIDPGVFVPRRRSEFLVSQAVQAIAALPPGGAGSHPGARPPVVVDMCCGTGAIGVAIASASPALIHAADIDPAAVTCARRNLAAVGGHVHQGDLFAALPPSLRGQIEVLAVNAPYVPTGEMGFLPPEARLYEPRIALDGGPDGTGLHRQVAAEAAEWLAPGARLLIETSERQAPLTAGAMTAGGLTASAVTDDDLDATVVIGRLHG